MHHTDISPGWGRQMKETWKTSRIRKEQSLELCGLVQIALYPKHAAPEENFWMKMQASYIGPLHQMKILMHASTCFEHRAVSIVIIIF